MDRDKIHRWLASSYFEPSQTDANAFPLPTDEKSFVLIPARNEEAGIGETIGKLLEGGIKAERIIVIDGSSRDTTAKIASRLGVTVIDMMEQISRCCRPGALGRFGVRLDPGRVCCGKGTAVFAALLSLNSKCVTDEARIFLLDADLGNLDEVNPLKYLNLVDRGTDGRFDFLTCAHPNRENELALAFWNAREQRNSRYWPMAAFTWPLCGQVMIRHGLLRRCVIASGYSLETVIRMNLLEIVELEKLGQVRLAVNLKDNPGDVSKYIAMYGGIITVASTILKSNRQLDTWDESDHLQVNSELADDGSILVTSSDGPNRFQDTLPEVLIPSINLLVEKDGIN